MLFLPQSLIVLIDFWLPSPLSWRTTTPGTVTFHLWTLKLEGTSLQDGHEGSPRKLQTCLSVLSTQKNYGEDHTGCY